MNRRRFLHQSWVLAISILYGKNLVANNKSENLSKITGFVYDDIYLDHWLHEGHPESPQRLIAIMKIAEASGLLARVKRLRPKQNILSELNKIHTIKHQNAIQQRYGKSHLVALSVVGGVLKAVDEVCQGKIKNAFCATRPPGHHATNTGRVEGFCFYNAIAIAARYAQNVYGLKKILIIDWDYHHGNGTEAAFYQDPTVLFFSTHDFFAYPGTGDPARNGEGEGKGYNINVHLDCGATDIDIINAFNEKLLPAAHKYKPDLILISAGFDSRKDDLLGCFNVTDEGFINLTNIAMHLANEYCGGKIVSVLEGGYNIKGNASATMAHVNTLLQA